MDSTGPLDLPRGNPRSDGGLLAVTLAYTAFGLGLWFQPDRWANTPSYALLLNILPQQVWGSIYLALAVLMACALRWRHSGGLVITAHTLAISLAASWWVAFVVRWVTDDGTTIVNVVSWGTYLLLLAWSAGGVGQRRTTA